MQFKDRTGIQATKEELKAILTFSGEGDEHKVCFKIKNGELVVWASIGGNAIYHQGMAFDFDGAGKPYKGTLSYEIGADTIATIHRMMEADDEVIFDTDDKGRMERFRVRSIDVTEAKMTGSLDGKVSTQLTFDMARLIEIARPLSAFGPRAIDWYPSTIKLLDTVSKAVGKGAITRFCLPEHELGQTYVQIAERSAIVDGDEPRWTVVLAAVDLDRRGVEAKKHQNRFDKIMSEPLPFDRDPPKPADPGETDEVSKALRERTAKDEPTKKSDKKPKPEKGKGKSKGSTKKSDKKPKPEKGKGKSKGSTKKTKKTEKPSNETKPAAPALEDFERDEEEEDDGIIDA